MSILIGADLVPTNSNEENFINGDIESLIGEELLILLRNANERIFNLEVPLTDKKNPINKCGPNLIASTNTIKGIKALNPTLLTLANNHILDQGEEGLESTRCILRENNIPYVGVGNNVFEAREPYIIIYENLKVGIYACAEHEFTIATENSSGANPFDPLESLDHIYSLRSNCDYVIVLYHGGKEHYRYPSPNLQKVCRKIIEKGADMVICQHSHCIGSMEKYKEGTIVYGQGNFLFDDSDCDYWQTSLLIKLDIKDRLEIEFIPLVKNGKGVDLAKGDKVTQILEDFYSRSDEICSTDFVKEKYREFSMENREKYMVSIAGFNRISRKLNKILNNRLINIRYRNNKLLTLKNYIECEAHRELILNAIDNK